MTFYLELNKNAWYTVHARLLTWLTGTLYEPLLMLLVTALLFLLSHVTVSSVKKACSIFYPYDIFNVILSHWVLHLLTVIFPRFPFSGENIYSFLNNHLSTMANSGSAVDLLGSSLHVWPDFHGNRSPLADPALKGMVREHESRLHVTYDMKYY